MASIRVSSQMKNQNALSVLLTKLREQQAEYVLQTARTMLEVATSRTPKYSGAATEGWRVSLSKDAANNVPAFSLTAFMMADSAYGPPKYEGGIYDPGAESLNRRVSGQANLVKANVMRRLQASGDTGVGLYLYNVQPYTQVWLQDMDLANFLREVNKDYWTMSEITQAVRLRLRNVNRELSGGIY